MFEKIAGAFRVTDWTRYRIDPDRLKRVATVSVNTGELRVKCWSMRYPMPVAS